MHYCDLLFWWGFFNNKNGGYLLHTMSYTTVNSQEISIDCISVLSWKVHAYNTVTIINDNAFIINDNYKRQFLYNENSEFN